ncbi:carboxymuconolactone decarboxylase family protein [Arthrobacter sp. H35-D1]|uniref:carboxymuconolactone decarboxylase family protein n=1 Tax=Arthrobacter sp. H35-D1 TaxID=3046202 RepID=UPI0024B901B3|nr:carboxymuconolactone decarboxylase family protein [Arthrobacter sp. H35-D1]MDJ0313563.1 carboxymuconolactone decarboxylase family protein [Arthrobacter sp. H35-D1]
MSIINTPDESDDGVADLYGPELEDLGYVPSHTRKMAANPEAFRAFQQLMRTIVSQLGERRFELATLAAADAVGSQSCRHAHGRKSLKLFEEEQLERIVRDYHDASLSEADVALMDFATKLSKDSSSMTDADSLRLRKAGFTDREIVDIALAASARNYLSRALQALAVEVDVPPGLSLTLKDALTSK